MKALIAFSKKLGYYPRLLNAVEYVNNTQSHHVLELAKRHLGNLQGKRIAILGLAFKPNTNDIREAVSKKIINKLLEEGANVIAYDPVAIPNTKMIFKDRIRYAKSVIECLKETECCIINTEWEEFRKLKPEDFIKQMKKPFVIDGRRIYNPKEFRRKLKLTAIGLG